MAAPTPPVRPATTTPVQPATTDPPVRPVATDPPARRFAPVVARRVPARRRLGNALYSAIGVVLFLFMSFPVYWMLNSSFLPTNKIRNAVPTFFPGADFTLRNYDTAIFGDHRAKFLPSLSQSLKVTFFALILALIVAFLASVALGRFRFRGRKAFIVGILVIQMIPGEAMMLTYFRMMDSWGLTAPGWKSVFGLGMIYLSAVLPFTIWTLRGFVTSVPAELEEAAMVDGLSRSQAFWRITFPLLAPGLISTGIFAFIQSWNEFTMALVIMQRPEQMTLPVWLRTFQQATKATDWGGLMAGSTLIAVPVLIFFLIVQGRMTGGMVSGAVKG